MAQGDLFGGIAGNEDGIDAALDAMRGKFGDDAIARGWGFGTGLVRQGTSKVE